MDKSNILIKITKNNQISSSLDRETLVSKYIKNQLFIASKSKVLEIEQFHKIILPEIKQVRDDRNKRIEINKINAFKTVEEKINKQNLNIGRS